MKWEYSPVGVLSMLDDYRNNAYPDDIKLDWKLHYSADPTRDVYVMVLQYRNPTRLGHLYAKASIDGMMVFFCESVGAIGSWIDIIKEKFDQCRMEIIECLDEQMLRPERPQPIHYRQEYPTNDDPFNWKAQYYDYEIMSYKDVVAKYGIKGVA